MAGDARLSQSRRLRRRHQAVLGAAPSMASAGVPASASLRTLTFLCHAGLCGADIGGHGGAPGTEDADARLDGSQACRGRCMRIGGATRRDIRHRPLRLACASLLCNEIQEAP